MLSIWRILDVTQWEMKPVCKVLIKREICSHVVHMPINFIYGLPINLYIYFFLNLKSHSIRVVFRSEKIGAIKIWKAGKPA